VSSARTPFEGGNPFAERYASLAQRCADVELHAIWAAILFGRRSLLRADLHAIADELDALRLEVGLASASRSTDNLPLPAASERTVPNGPVRIDGAA